MFLKIVSISSGVLFLTACSSQNKVPPPSKEQTRSISSTQIAPTQIVNVAHRPSYRDEIRAELETYLSQLEAFNTDYIVEKTYPKLFSVINQQHFRDYISTMTNSKDIMVEHFNTHITDIGELRNFSNGTQFVQVAYESNAKINFLNEQLYATRNSMNYLYDVLVHKYGRENIQMDVANRSLAIRKDEKMVMIKEANGEWKFIGDTPEYRRLYPKILPYEVYSNLE